mgnify:CR=1 FL=1
MEQTAQLPLCVPLIDPLLDFGGWLAPLPPPFCFGTYWIDHHLQILPAIIFLLSVSSLHMYSLSQMVVVLILFTSQPYGRIAIPFAISDVRLVVKRLRCTSIAAHTAPSLAPAAGGGQARGRRQELRI